VLENRVFSDPAFAELAEDTVLFVHVTSHLPDAPHPDLLRQKGGRAFPYVVFLDATGNVIAKPKVQTLDALREALERDVQEYRDLCELAASGDADAVRRLFALEVEFQHFADPEQARAAMAEIEGLSDEERARLEQILVEQEFNAILGRVTTEEQAVEAGRESLPMLEAGRIPKGPNAPYFWAFVGAHAAAKKDVELLERAISGLRETGTAGERFLGRLERALGALRR